LDVGGALLRQGAQEPEGGRIIALEQSGLGVAERPGDRDARERRARAQITTGTAIQRAGLPILTMVATIPSCRRPRGDRRVGFSARFALETPTEAPRRDGGRWW